MKGFTVFDNIWDNATTKTQSFDDWGRLVWLLKQLSDRPGYKPERNKPLTGKPSPLITPAEFIKGSKRRNDNVICWKGWCALDIDKYDGGFRKAIDLFKDYRYVCYSTASSTKEHPKFRIILDLSEDVPAEKIKHFWYAVNREFGSINDVQTKDLCRLYYIPGQYPKAFNFFIENEGKIMNPKEIMIKHTYVEPSTSFLSKLSPEMQKAILSHRRSELTNTAIRWTSYRDCQFLSKKLVNEYRVISESGWYHKMYCIMISIASNAIKSKYPITSNQIAQLAKEIDNETGGWYKNRPLETEANRALEYVLGSQL